MIPRVLTRRNTKYYEITIFRRIGNITSNTAQNRKIFIAGCALYEIVILYKPYNT